MSQALESDQTDPGSDAPAGPDPDYRRAFLRWGGGSYLVVTALLFAWSLHKTGGQIVYLIDDPAIHLSVAGNLAHHGTWGVVPGVFQSASSSPLWTLLLAGYLLVASGLRSIGIPLADNVGPLLINLLAGLWVIAIVAGEQRVLLPSRRRPLDALAVAVLVVFVLFLPALTLLGMEHTLHVALVLSAVVLFHRGASGRPTGWPRWLPYLLLGLATLARLETLFLAGAIGVAMLAQCLPGWGTGDPPRFASQFRRAVLVGLAALVPFTAFALFNKLMGQGWLPNSVLAKGQGVSGDPSSQFRLVSVLNRLTTDPLLAAMAAIAAGALLVGWRQGRRYTFVAIVFLVATAGHVTLAQVGWFERYQAYLVALGVLTLLAIADETVPSARRVPARAFLVPGLTVLALLLCVTKVDLTLKVPVAVDDTYQQRYQAGQFLAEYYDGQPVATGELGYVSLEHDGPLTDLLGLGDYEVLQERRSSHQHPGRDYWAQLARDRGFKVAAVYPTTLLFDTPDDWILVGEWHMNRGTVTALDPTFQFWATTPEEVAPLEEHLRDFESRMPAGSTLAINELAEFRAADLMKGDSGG